MGLPDSVPPRRAGLPPRYIRRSRPPRRLSMVAKKHTTKHRTDEDRKAATAREADRTDRKDQVEDETLRHAGVENTAPNDKARQAVEHNEANHRNPPPLQHVNPV